MYVPYAVRSLRMLHCLLYQFAIVCVNFDLLLGCTLNLLFYFLGQVGDPSMSLGVGDLSWVGAIDACIGIVPSVRVSAPPQSGTFHLPKSLKNTNLETSSICCFLVVVSCPSLLGWVQHL